MISWFHAHVSVLNARREGWFVPMGPNVNAFEQDLANFANNNSDGTQLDRKVVCLSAGTTTPEPLRFA